MSRVTSELYKEINMQISMKCSVAVHCLIFINEAYGRVKVTSDLLSESTGSNPVIIRNILSSLKKAGIIKVARGTGGAELNIKADEINLYMIHSAVEPDGLSSLIGIHQCRERKCPVAQNIQAVLEKPYNKIEESIKKTMQEITLKSMIDDFHILYPDSASYKI